MLPNLRHLQLFRETARRGSVSAASRALHVSQPAATQAIACLERYFDGPLFERRSSGMMLNAAGTACLARVERALQHLGDPRLPAGNLGRTVTAAQLKALVAIVEQGGFARAAHAMTRSRSTVHRAARQLERSAGVELFEQTSFGVRPTREAGRIARRAQLAFAELEQARAEVDALVGGASGRTVIGAMPLARSVLVPSAVLEFAVEHPGHTLSILEGPYENLLAALRSGEVGFLIGAERAPLPEPDVVQEHLFSDPLAIIVRADHPLVYEARLTSHALARFPWIAPRASSPLRRHFNELFVRAGLPVPERPIECNSLAAARAILLEGDHAMLLSAQQVGYELEAGMLAALPHPAGRVLRPIGLTMRRDWRPTAVQQRLLALVRDHARILDRHWCARCLPPSARPRATPESDV